MQGTEVSVMQKRLIDSRDILDGDADGVVSGSRTKAAVIVKFQRENEPGARRYRREQNALRAVFADSAVDNTV